VVGGTNVVRDGESVTAMGKAPFIAVSTKGTRDTVLAFAVAKNAV
jgi:hypothetical protein